MQSDAIRLAALTKEAQVRADNINVTQLVVAGTQKLPSVFGEVPMGELRLLVEW